ncbi:MAG: hypothetical protein ACLGHX_01900, partial [Acidimicrobiia bacterium]
MGTAGNGGAQAEVMVEVASLVPEGGVANVAVWMTAEFVMRTTERQVDLSEQVRIRVEMVPKGADLRRIPFTSRDTVVVDAGDGPLPYFTCLEVPVSSLYPTGTVLALHPFDAQRSLGNVAYQPFDHVEPPEIEVVEPAMAGEPACTSDELEQGAIELRADAKAESPDRQTAGNRQVAEALQLFSRPLGRSGADRPDQLGGHRFKVVYITAADGPDYRRDENGEIAEAVFWLNHTFAQQNGGFGLRFDTYEGALDVQHVQLDATLAELPSIFSTPASSNGGDRQRATRVLGENGIPVEPLPVQSGGIHNTGGDVAYLLVVEGSRGDYFGTAT